jgi:hypothetical protein
MIGKIGSMVLVAGIIANAGRLFLGVEKGEGCKKGEHQDGGFHDFLERISASNVPASW